MFAFFCFLGLLLETRACYDSTYLSTNSGEISNIVVSTDISVQLTVTTDESSSVPSISLSFHGSTSASDRVTESTSDGQWVYHVSASPVTEPPRSSAESSGMIFFSDASISASSFLIMGPLAFANAQAGCSEAATLVVALPSGWVTSSSAEHEVHLMFDPKVWGYDIELSLSSHALVELGLNYFADCMTAGDDFSLCYQADPSVFEVFINSLSAAFGGDTLTYRVAGATFDSNSTLVLEVEILRFPDESSAFASFEAVSSADTIDLGLSSPVPITASPPSLVCSPGYSTENDRCVDHDSCLEAACSSDGVCSDLHPPESGFTCECNPGLFFNGATCADIDGCSDNTCRGSGDNSSQCVDVGAPGTGYTCNCTEPAYFDDHGTCMDIDSCSLDFLSINAEFGINNWTESCRRDGDVEASCIDVVAPGQGITCFCSSGFHSSGDNCPRNDCGSAYAQTGYVITYNSTLFEDSATVVCDAGYAGSPQDITCQASGYWLSVSGCTIQSCNPSPTQTGYAIASGAFTYGATRTVSCATGYTGTASTIRCLSDLTWTSSSGCTIRDCGSPASVTGYTISPGGTTYGSTRSVTCATGYTGTAVSLTCQSSGSWTSASGCNIVNCGNPVASTGYVTGSGSTTYQSSYSMTCATGYTGTAAPITCQSSGSWSSQSGCTIVSCSSSPTQTGYTISEGASTYGSSRSVTCATGYTGTASSITCASSGSWSTPAGCTIVNCGTPTAGTGYVRGSGSTTYGSTFSMTCAAGYSGTAAALTCQSSGSWTAQSGCTIVSCSSSPTQTGYTISSGASTYGSTRTVSCGTGMSGTASSISCQASGAWTTSAGCSDINGCSDTTVCGSGNTCVDVAAPGTGYTCSCGFSFVSLGGSCRLRWESVGTLAQFDSIRSTYSAMNYEFGLYYNGDIQPAFINGWNRGTRITLSPAFPHGDNLSSVSFGTCVFTRNLDETAGVFFHHYYSWDTNGNTWYSGGNGDASGLGFYVRRLIQPWQNVGTLNNYDSIKSTYPSSQYEYGISYNGDVQRATCNGWNRGTRVAAFPFYPQGDSASGLWWGTTVFTRGLENGGSTWYQAYYRGYRTYIGSNGESGGLAFFVKRHQTNWAYVGALSTLDSILSTYSIMNYEFGYAYNGDIAPCLVTYWDRGTRVLIYPPYPQFDTSTSLVWGTAVICRGCDDANDGNWWHNYYNLNCNGYIDCSIGGNGNLNGLGMYARALPNPWVALNSNLGNLASIRSNYPSDRYQLGSAYNTYIPRDMFVSGWNRGLVATLYPFTPQGNNVHSFNFGTAVFGCGKDDTGACYSSWTHKYKAYPATDASSNGASAGQTLYVRYLDTQNWWAYSSYANA